MQNQIKFNIKFNPPASQAKARLRNNGLLILGASMLAACSNSNSSSTTTNQGITPVTITNTNIDNIGTAGTRNLHEISVELFNTAVGELGANQDSAKFQIYGGAKTNTGSTTTEFDELRFTGTGKVIDLSSGEIVNRLHSLEVFDINGSGNNELRLSANSVSRISDGKFGDDDIIIVKGGDGDKLALTGDWNLVSDGQVVLKRGDNNDDDGVIYNVFESGDARVAVPQDKDFIVTESGGTTNINTSEAGFNSDLGNLHFGSDLADTINGGRGADTIIGNNGVDILNGGDGSDILDGGSDGDRLLGMAGNDILTGGLGSDVFVVSAGADVIIDFSNGIRRQADRLDFTAFEEVSQLTIARSGVDLRITGSDSDDANFDVTMNNMFGTNQRFADDTTTDTDVEVNALFTVNDGILITQFFIGIASDVDIV